MPTPSIIEFSSHEQTIRLALPASGDPLLHEIRCNGNFHRHAVLADVGASLPEGALVADVGARFGNDTVFFAKVMGLRTIAFQGAGPDLALLRQNIEINGVQERVELHEALPGSARVGTIDTLACRRSIDLIRIGARCALPDVIAGAVETLQHSHPLILADIADEYSMTVADLLLGAHGYRRVKSYDASRTQLYRFEPVTQNTGSGSGTAQSALRQIDPRDRARLPPTKLVVAGMATVPGSEDALQAALDSLLPQVDRVDLCLNGHTDAPDFVRAEPRIRWTLDPDGTRPGDAGKFWGVQDCEDTLYFSCDDDLVYPPDYVRRMARALARLDGPGVVTVQGALLRQPAKRFHSERTQVLFALNRALLRGRRVHVPGTGTTAFHTSVIRPALDDFPQANMADLWLARLLQLRGLPVHAIARPAHWLGQSPLQRPSITEHSTRRCHGPYDTSAAQDALMQGLRPLSIIRPAAPPGRRQTVHLVDVHQNHGLPALLRRLASLERDPVIVLQDVRPGTNAPLLSQSPIHDLPSCEVHVIEPGCTPEMHLRYRELLEDPQVELHRVSLPDVSPRPDLRPLTTADLATQAA